MDIRWDWLALPPQEAAAIVRHRSYGRDRFGCYSTEEYVTVNGVFYWFDSILEMLTFIATVEPLIFDQGEDGDVVKQLRAIVDRQRAISPDLRRSINAASKGLFRIDWWGRGGELATSRTDFAQELRREFRQGGPTSPILLAEMREWEKFIRKYK